MSGRGAKSLCWHITTVYCFATTWLNDRIYCKSTSGLCSTMVHTKCSIVQAAHAFQLVMLVLLVSCKGSAPAGGAALHSVCRGVPSAHRDSASAAILCTCAHGTFTGMKPLPDPMEIFAAQHTAIAPNSRLWGAPRLPPVRLTGWRPHGASCCWTAAQTAAQPPSAGPPAALQKLLTVTSSAPISSLQSMEGPHCSYKQNTAHALAAQTRGLLIEH